MAHRVKHNIAYEEIDNGALVLLLLQESKTWQALCGRYAYADPAKIRTNTVTQRLLKKLFEMRELGLVHFEDEETADGPIPVGTIEETLLSSSVRAAYGGVSLSDVAMVSRHAEGMAIAPIFRRPSPLPVDQHADVFVLMPFKTKLEAVYAGT